VTILHQVDDDRVQELLGRLQRRGDDLRPPLESIGRYMVDTSIPLTFRSGGRPEPWKPVLRGGKPLLNSRRLQGSITHRVVRGNELRVGTARRGARLHQLGGTIRPRNARAIAVPLPGTKAAPRRYSRTFILYRKDGDRIGLIVQKVGRDKLRPLFVLKTQVHIDARPFLVWLSEDVQRAEQVLVRYLGASR